MYRTRRHSESEYIHQVNGFVDRDGLGREIGCMREMTDALWEGHTLLKTGLSAQDRQTDRQTSKNSISARLCQTSHNRPTVIEMLDLGACVYLTQL